MPTHTILACTGLLLPMYFGVLSTTTPFAIPPKLAPDEEMSFHLIEKVLWSELDNALAGIQGLEEFMIKLPSEGDAADFEPLKDAIKEGMPRARDRGVLVFRMKRGV